MGLIKSELSVSKILSCALRAHGLPILTRKVGEEHEGTNCITYSKGSTSVVGLEDMALRVVVAAIIDWPFSFLYWISHAGTIYSQKFNINLITLTVLTATVMAVIGQQHRTVPWYGRCFVHRPLPYRYQGCARHHLSIFWAIIAGICCGVASSWRQRSAALWCSSSCWCWDACATTCARS